MPDAPFVDVNETKAAASSLLDWNNYNAPTELLQKTESQTALNTLIDDARVLAKESPADFMKDQWLLNQRFDGFPQILINDDRSITLAAGIPDGSRKITVRANEIEVTDQSGQKGFSHQETDKRRF